jgi:hypothetical protein
MFFAGLASLAAQPPTSEHAELIKTLRRAHKLLVEADHDYAGHRAKAAEEVHKALEGLGFHHKKVQPGTTAGNGTVVPPQTAHPPQPKVREPQANSDAQLRKARKHLKEALTLFSGTHPKATGNVEKAIGEIDTALGIK